MADPINRVHSKRVKHARIRHARKLKGFLEEQRVDLDATGAAATFTANAAAEVFVMTVTAGNVDTADSTIAFDGVLITITNPSATPTLIADDFATQYNVAGTGTWTAVGNGNGTVTLTANANGARTDVVGGDFVYTANTADTAAVTFTAALKEVFVMTVTAGNVNTADSTIDFDGVQITIANPSATPTLIADDFATQYNAAGTGTWTAVGNGNGTVTFTAKTTGARVDIVLGDFVYTANTADIAAVTFTAAAPTTQGVGPTTQGVDAIITWTGHGQVRGAGPFLLTTTGALPVGLDLAKQYWIGSVIDVNTVSLSTRRAQPVDAIVGGAGSGTHTITKASNALAITSHLNQSGSTILRNATDVDDL